MPLWNWNMSFPVVHCLFWEPWDYYIFTWFTTYPGISKEAFGQLLHILHNFLLPIGNVLPATYAEARTVVKPMLVPVEEYHCCVNDCVVFRGVLKNETQCPLCGEARFTSGHIPRKRFKYIPLGPRIKQY